MMKHIVHSASCKKIAALVLFGVCAASFLSAADLDAVAVVKLVKSEPITVKQLRTAVDQVEQGTGKKLTLDDRKQVLNDLIDEKLVLQAAERDKITVNNNEIDAQIQQLKNVLAQQAGRQPTDAEFAKALKDQTGLELPAYREQLRKQLIAQRYLVAKKGNIVDGIKAPTGAEIEEWYTLNKTQFVRPETVRLSLIQVPFDGSTKAAEKDMATKLAAKMGASASAFDEEVVKGQANGSGVNAGDFGYLPRNAEAQQVVGAEFMNTAFALDTGKVSKLLEGQNGFQIMKVTEKYNQKNLELDDIVQLGTRVTVRQYIENGLLQQKQAAAVQKASAELLADLRKDKPFTINDKNINW